MYYTTTEIMERFGVRRDRVAKIARARKWRFIEKMVRNTRAKLYLVEDVEKEAKRREGLGLKQ